MAAHEARPRRGHQAPANRRCDVGSQGQARLAGTCEIGEAIAGLPPDFLAANPGVNWRGLKVLRIVLVHRYFEPDWNRVADALEHDLPADCERIEAILHGLG